MWFNNRLSKRINLWLISSSLILAGCSPHHPNEDERDRPGRGGYLIYPHAVPLPPTEGTVIFPHAGGTAVFSGHGIASGGGAKAPSISVRGGFGGIGHATAGS